jgi:hypothetical protein
LAREGLEEEEEEGRKEEKNRAGRSKVGKVSRFIGETPTAAPKVGWDPLTREEEKNLDSGLFAFWWGNSTPLHTCFLPPARGRDAPGPLGWDGLGHDRPMSPLKFRGGLLSIVQVHQAQVPYLAPV